MVRKEIYNPFTYVVKFPKTKFKQYNRIKQKDNAITYWTVEQFSPLWYLVSGWIEQGEVKGFYTWYQSPSYGKDRYKVLQTNIMKLAAVREVCNESLFYDLITNRLLNRGSTASQISPKQWRTLNDNMNFFHTFKGSYNYHWVRKDIRTIEELEEIFALTDKAEREGFVSVDKRLI